LLDHELHATVLGARGLRGPLLERLGLPITLGAEALGADALVDQVLAHRVGALLAEALVHVFGAGVVGVPLDANLPDLGVRLDHQGHLIQERMGLFVHLRGAVFEAYGVEDHELPVLVDDPRIAGVGTAVVVFESVDGLLGLRAIVLVIGDAVLIAVRIFLRTAVHVFDPIHVFWIVGAGILRIWNAVALGVV